MTSLLPASSASSPFSQEEESKTMPSQALANESTPMLSPTSVHATQTKVKDLKEIDEAIHLINFTHAFLDSQRMRTLKVFKKILRNFSNHELLFLHAKSVNSHHEKVEYLERMISHLQQVNFKPEKVNNLLKKARKIKILYNFFSKEISILNLPKNFSVKNYDEGILHKARQLKILFSFDSYIKTVKYLDLSQQDLRFLPTEIKFFTQLKVINLSGNRFTSLPTELFELSGVEIRIERSFVEFLQKKSALFKHRLIENV